MQDQVGTLRDGYRRLQRRHWWDPLARIELRRKGQQRTDPGMGIPKGLTIGLQGRKKIIHASAPLSKNAGQTTGLKVAGKNSLRKLAGDLGTHNSCPRRVPKGEPSGNRPYQRRSQFGKEGEKGFEWGALCLED